jgi:LacI family transcriptional regulator
LLNHVKFDFSAQTFANKFAVEKLHICLSYMNVTLKKISEVLGLSISTVSRALQNHPDISSNTRQKVIELAAVLDYEPNANAINLRKQNSKVFGLIVPSVSNSFYDSFMSAVEERCRQTGYSLIIMQSADDPETERNILKIYRQNRVAGCFACLSPGKTDMSSFKKLDDLDIPIVFFDKVPDEDGCTKVYIDNKAAAEQAAEALIRKGKKKILALFGSEAFAISRLRKEAFMQMFEDRPEILLFPENAVSSIEATTITSKYFNRPEKPDAIFCMSDEIMLGVMKTVQQLQIRYPEDVSIITMSDGYYPKLYYPEITYIETSGYKLGIIAYEMMEKCMSEENEGIIHQKAVEPMLVDGGSI